MANLVDAALALVWALLLDNQAMTDPDIAILHAVAADYDAAGPQFATLAALMRRVAGKLHEANSQDNRCSPLGNDCVVDGDDVLGYACPNCDD